MPSKEQRQKEVPEHEVSFWLNSYNDLFSDFDHRSYALRAISDDFLAEAKKFTRDKTEEKLELRFLVPILQRKKSHEPLIRKRLHEHFRKHYHRLLHEKKKTWWKGLTLTIIGVLFMAGASAVALFGRQGKLLNLLLVILEPGGWFMTWMGLDGMFSASGARNADLEFYEKMSNCEIVFGGY